MDSLSGGYNIAYPRRNQVLVAKDGALDFSGNWDGATIFDVKEVNEGSGQPYYSIKVGDKYIIPSGDGKLALKSNPLLVDAHWMISGTSCEHDIGDDDKGWWVLDTDKNELSVKAPGDGEVKPTNFDFSEAFRF